MSHIHLPDGILPVWLWLTGYLLSSILIAAFWKGGKATAEPRKFSLLGVFVAIMILVMMIEFPPFAFHFNLSVVAGIILGPQLSVLAALVVNIILALIGHGGVTVVGLNTFVLSTEMIAGYYSFKFLRKFMKSIAQAGFISTIVGLAMGSGLAFGIIALGSKWIDAGLRAGKVEAGELHATSPHFMLARFAIIMFGFGAIGWILEGFLSAVILNSLNRIYPSLFDKHRLE